MSDVPVAPAPETPQNVVGTVDAPPPGSQPADAPKPDAPERTFTQKELDEILEKRLSKERRKREDLKQERDVLRKLALERGEERPEPKHEPKPADSGEPKREQFGTYEEYVEARAEWRADQRVDKKFKEREESQRQLTEREKQQKEAAEFRKRMKDTAKDVEDFDDVISGIRADDPVANVSGHAIDACDNPGKMLYHLAKHPEEAERIAGLPMGKQAREMLEMERKLATPAQKPSKAPEPIDPVGGRAAVGDEMPNPSKDPEGWVAWRNKQITAQRGKVRAS